MDNLPPGFELFTPKEAKAACHREYGKGLPKILVMPGNLSQIVENAEAAIMASRSAHVYQRGTMLVRPAMVPIRISGGRETMAQCLSVLGPSALLDVLNAVAEWFKPRAKGKPTPIDCPPQVAKLLLARAGKWELPVLTGIVNAPTMREDGSIVHDVGYDKPTGLLFDPQGKTFPRVADAPTREDAIGALAKLKDLISTFRFTSDAAQSVALSAMLTAPVRRTLASAPLHGFSAPVAGSGKSMLVDLASIVATGHEAEVVEEGDADELPKRLGAALLGGHQVISIDNIERAPVAGGFLCQALTQPFLQIRILGQSENRIVVPDAFLCATGNNLAFAGDMTRRALLCTIDPCCERPELREFSVDPVAAAKAERARYVHAALTVLRAYHVAGRPKVVGPCGSFETWSRLVRSALVWLGEADPWQTTQLVRGSDPRLEALTAVIQEWHTVIGGEPITVRQLIERATQRNPSFGALEKDEFTHPDLREALLAVAGRGGVINGNSLGAWLRANRGRIVGGLKLERGGVRRGNIVWHLLEV